MLFWLVSKNGYSEATGQRARRPSSSHRNAFRWRSLSVETVTPRFWRVSERWTRPRKSDQREPRLLEEEEDPVGLRVAEVVGVEVVPHPLELAVGGEPRRHDLLDPLPEPLHALEEKGDVELLLRAVVEVDGPHRELGLAGDVLHRGPGVAFVPEDLDGGRLDGLTSGPPLPHLPLQSSQGA